MAPPSASLAMASPKCWASCSSSDRAVGETPLVVGGWKEVTPHLVVHFAGVGGLSPNILMQEKGTRHGMGNGAEKLIKHKSHLFMAVLMDGAGNGPCGRCFLDGRLGTRGQVKGIHSEKYILHAVAI